MGVRLPSEYQEVEYLESTGTQYIQTDYTPQNHDEIVCDFTITKVISGLEYLCLFSAGTGQYQLIVLLANDTTGSQRVEGAYYKYFATGTAQNFYFYPSVNNFYRFVINSDGFASCNGYSIQSQYKGTLNTNLRIMRRANGDANFVGRIYKFELSNDGEGRINLIPCYRKADSKPGMYDLVTKQFFTNAGTGEFLVGPDVIDSISPLMVAWRRIMMAAASVAKKLTKLIVTSTTGLVSFDTNVEMPTKVTCDFAPVQEGTGDPSPDNVRPISGWTGANIYHPFNQVSNIEWEQGAIQGSESITDTYNNKKSSNATRIRVKNLVYLDAAKEYVFYCGEGYDYCLQNYDAITGVSILSVPPYNIWFRGATKTIITGQTAMAIAVRKSNQANIVPSEIASTGFVFGLSNCLPINWETEAGIIYGGTVTLNEDGSVDLVNGRALYTFDGSSDEEWTNGGYGAQAKLYLPESITDVVEIKTGAKVTDAVANYFTFVSQNSNWYAKDNIIATASSYTYLRCDTIGNLANWRPYLAEHPITICFKRKTPITYHFDNIGQLKAFLGTNNIWHNMNGDITVEYWNKQ